MRTATDEAGRPVDPVDAVEPVDGAGFALLFHAEARRLVRLAALLGAEDPEDVVQEAFCRVYASRARLHDDDRLRAYLKRAVVNEVRDRHRHRQVVRRDRHLVATREVAADPLGVAERDEVVRAIAALPHRQREALVLRFWLDLPLAEVAETMGTRLGTAKSHVSRALAAVEAHLRADPHDGAATPEGHDGGRR